MNYKTALHKLCTDNPTTLSSRNLLKFLIDNLPDICRSCATISECPYIIISEYLKVQYPSSRPRLQFPGCQIAQCADLLARYKTVEYQLNRMYEKEDK